MSLAKPNIMHNVKQQYRYKLRSYIWIFNSLLMLQLLGLLFSIGGSASTGSGGNGYSVDVNYYSADIMIGFTMFWAFIISMQITSNKENEFMFITNKVSHHLSDAIFLITASIIGGVTSVASGYLLKVVIYFVMESSGVLLTAAISSPKYLIIGLLATFLLIFLFTSLGYLVGKLVQVNKIFIFLLPILFIGLLFIANKYGDSNFMFMLFDFYFKETVFLVFMAKVFITSVLLFFGAFLVSKRLEVRQ